MIHIGNQTSCWASPLTLPFDYAVANGFDAFEWFPDKKPGFGWDENDLNEAQRRSIRETARMQGMRLSVHARWQADPLQSEAAPWLLADLQLAQDLGAALLNIHLWHEAGLDTFIDAITPLARRVAAAGLQLAIENTPLHPPVLFNELFAKLRARAGFPALEVGMCLDLGHANLCAATLNDYLAFVDRLDAGVPLIHIHLHENWGDADTHLPLFTGPSAREDSGIRGFLERLQRRQFSGSIILEQWPQPPSLLNNARDRLLEMIPDAQKGRAPRGGGSGAGPDVRIPLTPALSQREREDVRQSAEESETAGNFESLAQALPLPLGEGRGEGDSQGVARSSRPTTSAADDFTASLISADKHARSWREKLEAVHTLLAQAIPASTRNPQPATRSIPPEHLVALAIYLRFLGTGEIPCVEDGRHFRPGHHARIAHQIQQQFAGLTTPEMASVARRVYRWLPSSAETFRRAEPLTRIRDIAHRNDIPADLKREIKHSLQNKLHRCAGPEDLATSSALLERIAPPEAGYSAGFVEQFRLFHEELKEFFNARSLDQRLEALLPQADAEQARLIRSLLDQKSPSSSVSSSKAEGGSRTRTRTRTKGSEDLTLLCTLTDLRRNLLASTKPGTSPEEQSRHQERLMADIGLEDFAFVLLSRMLNASAPPMRDLMETLRLSLNNLALSSIAPEECRALDSELRAWQEGFDPTVREQLLRLKATVDRSRRVAEDYSDRILSLFERQAATLGRALGVPEPAVRVYCEGEIRGHLVFQLSKLASLMLRLLREQLALPAWDVIVPGEASGRVTLGAPASLPASSQEHEHAGKDAGAPSVIALLDHAEGDEEIPDGVHAIVLAHEIPHLSHLGVRARQAGVVFIASDDRTELEKLESLQGHMVSLVATPETVQWFRQTRDSTQAPALHRDVTATSAGSPFARKRPNVLPLPEGEGRGEGERCALLRDSEAPSAHLRCGPSSCEGGIQWLPLDKVVPKTGGAKAFGARRLAELARRKEAGFLTPHAVVIPFAVQQAGLAEDLDSMVLREFGPDARLMVRSSANVEDLEEFSGAGLYESVANVTAAGVVSAIQRVWGSLRSERAARSRQQAGIPEDSARMAVLIQQMLAPDYSFIIHTLNPINRNPREVYIELAVGLGETLASAAVRGTPYRLVCNTESAEVATLSFASFSEALQAAPGAAGGIVGRTLDYSQVELSCDAEARLTLARRLSRLARFVEEAFQKPQDIEGGVVGKDIYLVQARPQQGLTP